MSEKKSATKGLSLTKQLKKAILSYYNNEKGAIAAAIRIGELMNKAKDKHGAKKFHTKMDQVFPKLHLRTRQRFMRLADEIDLKKFPFLAYISQNKLLTIISLAKSNTKNVGDYIAVQIDTDFNPKKLTELLTFKHDVDELISDNKKTHQKGNEPDTSSSIYVQFFDWLKKLKDEQAEVTEDDLKHLKLIKKRVSKILKRLNH